MLASKIALGTAQFGLNYGISNTSGKVPLNSIKSILGLAKNSGIDTIDTAIAYGNSESMLGMAGCKDWKIVTKIPQLTQNSADISTWVSDQVFSSMKRLNVEHIDTILFHHPEQLLSKNGDNFFHELKKLKEDGYIKKIGISIYGTEHIAEITTSYDIDIIQCPLNILDRRILDSEFLNKLICRKIEIHARSIFLQGLLLMTHEERSNRFPKYNKLWLEWNNWLNDNRVHPLSACLGYVLNIPSINKVVIGVQNKTQLEEILTSISDDPPEVPNWLNLYDDELINPSKW